MNFWVYKLAFSTEVHIGNGLLTDSDYTMYADTFFSALCLEALKIYGVEGIEKLKTMAMEDKLVLSDGFPYIKDKLYIPKGYICAKKNMEKNKISSFRNME